MEHLTLVIIMTLVSIIMMMTMAAMYLVSRDEKCLFDWVLAGAAFLSSNATVLLVHPLTYPPVELVALINACYVTGHAFVLSGVSWLVTGRTMRRFALGIFLFAFLIHFIPGIADSVKARLLIFSPLVIALGGAAVAALWKYRTRRWGKVFYPLMAVIGLFIIIYALRIFVLVSWTERLTFMGDQALQTSGSLLLIGYYFLLTVCFMVVVSWKKELTLREAAVTDHLTGCLNRKALDTLADKALSHAQRHGEQLAFIMLDIDHFKTINDNHGHVVGDRVIKQVSALIASHVRGHDSLFRLGGEEFLLLVSGTTQEKASGLAERICRSVAQTPCLQEKAQSIRVTISAGLALTDGREASWQQTLEHADMALYDAKRNGRNRIAEWAGTPATV
ncbi:GGDEF domain-containing protein [Alteromonas sp. CYL-A6]|uniref:GGDEF domain-containing protein n=1 Tax=Alteromonas nitratireducens TaxID=3390813 RepID=UPI0034A9AAB1